ncbi:uncharacterized protein K444DRAFT_634029 [Hyaloscypha bicolor E]|uniref:Uncharacterized protein n=1 Tax=Hyaloscypha bicolor E TaxID=1095630 RepID=A0A2J6SWQ6_9HELO|nr:uncharacterized protein K444DRAFT_634029 [Hyaloscypha bicolor E]PMD55181.1 hypothetical protein K444DRAFT_634029 [Hyaloscypha bicolor E]
MFGPDGSSRTPALKAESSRELHGMLPRSTRDKAGGRRTRHGLGWRGERRGWRGRKGRRGRSVIQGGAGTKGNNETRPQSPGAAALQRTQSAHSAPTLIRDQDPILVLVLCESTGQCLRDFANLAGGTQYAAECCVGSRPLSTIKVAGWGLVRCRFASTSGIPSPSFTNRRLHTYWELWMASWNSNVRIPMSRMHLAVYIQPSGLHPLRRACPRDVKFHDSCWGLPQTQTAAQPSGSRQGPISWSLDDSDHPTKLIHTRRCSPIRGPSASPSQTECDDPFSSGTLEKTSRNSTIDFLAHQVP